MLCYKDVADVYEVGGISGTLELETKTIVNASLEKVNATLNDYYYYWSSSESAGFDGMGAFKVSLDGADVSLIDKCNTNGYVRAVCAY